jgi:hypothetical protein
MLVSVRLVEWLVWLPWQPSIGCGNTYDYNGYHAYASKHVRLGYLSLCKVN